MSPRTRRIISVTLSILVLGAALAFMQQRAEPVHTFRIVLGLNDREPADWSGKITVSGGEVVAIEGWRFQGKDKVNGTNGWQCRTRNYIAPGKRWPVTTGEGKPRYQPDLQPWPNGVTVRVRGKTPKVHVKLPKGEFQLQLQDLRLGVPRQFLDGQVRVEAMPTVSIVRPASKLSPKSPDAYQDDYPCFWVHYATGRQYLAWVSYRKEADRVYLTWREGAEGDWRTPLIVAGKGHHFRVALATTHGGKLWIVWASQKNGNWDLYARTLENDHLGKIVRLTDAPGPDIWHRMTTDSRGRAWLVWQGFRDGQSDIFARCADGDGWHDPVKVSISPTNDWDPAVAADPMRDRVWIGWDSYTGENYAVRIRSLAGGPKPKLDRVLEPEPCPLFQAHISLACDAQGRLWAAWDESGPQWGKDTGFLYGGQHRKDTSRLYSSRAIRVRVLSDGKWREPKEDFSRSLPGNMLEYNEYPQLQADKDGRIWLAFRHRTCIRPREDGWAVRGRWDLFVTAYLGDRWLAPIAVPDSGGRNDMRTSSQRDARGAVYFAFASDNRRWFPPSMLPRNHHVAVARFAGAPAVGPMRLVERKRTYPVVAPCHPREQQEVARIRKYAVKVGGKVYHIYRGDLHRHTDISVDGMGDGSIVDLHRYALDAAAFDYILVGDHNMGQDNEYCWWRTQHANDLYTVPGRFISMYGYERSVRYPRGHRNVIWTERGHRTLPLPKPIPAQFNRDTDRLYAYLRRTGGICTLHTSASSQGTDWTDKIDPELEPFVEIFQGYHTSYEAPGAPKAIDAKTDRIHGKFEPAGFVSRGLAKGYKLGFQASSDHISTHVSYACILAEEFSRKGLVEAMKKRHTYAATDNIVMDVRMGNHLMGDEVTAARPGLQVVILGTGPILSVDIVRNGKVVHKVQPKAEGTEEIRFEWTDPQPIRGKTSYYYVRMQQRNGQMAWASPIWVKVP